ncbi:hypothetical protein [Humisphaera borealis]|uniref:MipA/OmpV family protein n=1 Tax=Humisphaera borealis TaxID=2807512 RepID=A0A7M2WUV1_9BACT|nr:hypothetical protein [Humisphaera borealis]QOV89317.1 hypothetical protein IPV69_24435 [Humisphaera borealis]
MTLARRPSLLLTLALLAAGSGCTASREAAGPNEPPSITSTRFPDAAGGNPIAASALVFDPPITLAEAPIYLGRENRGPAAFFGYEEGFTEYYRLSVDDRQTFNGGVGYGYSGGNWGGNSGGWYDRYDRRAVSVKTGVIRR